MADQLATGLDPAAVAAYLTRLGVRDPVRAGSPGALAHVQEQHLRTVPFENLDVVAGRRLDYRLPALLDKIVVRRRGGWCLETNWLLGHVLAALGYRVGCTGAGVATRRGFKDDRSHLMLTVGTDDGDHLVDVGFGHGGYPRPLPARTGEYAHGLDVHRVERDGDRAVVSQVVDGVAVPLYRTSPGTRHIDDFAATSAFHEGSPASPFHTMPHCVRLTPDGWASVLGDRLLLRAERTVEYPLHDPARHAAVLAWVVGDAPGPPPALLTPLTTSSAAAPSGTGVTP